jgi:hypothetical protein
MDCNVNEDPKLESGGSITFGRVIDGGEVENSSGTETTTSDDEGEFGP